MKFVSKTKHTSKLAGFEGVTFTLKKMTEGRRIQLNLSLAGAKARLRETIAKIREIEPDLDLVKMSEHDQAKFRTLDDAYMAVMDEINVGWVRWGLDSVEGLEIDEQPATVETLISDGPLELFTEIHESIKKQAELTPEETKN